MHRAVRRQKGFMGLGVLQPRVDNRPENRKKKVPVSSEENSYMYMYSTL